MDKFVVKRKEVKDDKKEIQVSEDTFAIIRAINELCRSVDNVAQRIQIR